MTIVIPRGTVPLGDGTNANVYPLSSERVVKVLKREFSMDRGLYNELDIQGQLSRAGYPVPRPYEIFPVRVEEPRQGFYDSFGLVMDFAPGVQAHYAKDVLKVMGEAKEILSQIAESEGIRISPFYRLYTRNVLYHEPENQITLIDFANWERVKL